MFKIYFVRVPIHFIMAFSMIVLVCSCKHKVKKIDSPDPIIVPVILQKDKDDRLEGIFDDADTSKDQYPFFKELVASKEEMLGGVWTKDSVVLGNTDTLIKILDNAPYFGMLSKWYKLDDLKNQLKLLSDTTKRLDVSNWALLEIKLTHSFLAFCNDIHFGRIQEDSIDQRTIRRLNDSMAISLIRRVKNKESLSAILSSLEPRHLGYHLLREKLSAFIPNMNNKKYTFIDFPWKDSLLFVNQLNTRLVEAGYIEKDSRIDSVSLSKGIKKAQKAMGLKVDGKAGIDLSATLNKWDFVEFARMAINMDRYKLLPESMPSEYVFVNIPSFTLRVFHDDTMVVKSKVIVGKVITPSPVLNSTFTNLVLYPQWTVPYSIVFKEIVPKMAKDPTYLKAENMFVVDKKDSIVDPGTIMWKKINPTNFHYLIRQGEGIDNSLGVIKFNFSNKYAVYLHDTNTRFLFSQANRMMSHGCIRVEKWMDLASFLIQPLISPKPSDELKKYFSDEKKKFVPLKSKVPLFIRYFTWYELDGEMKHFQDGYGMDNKLIYSYLHS